MIDRQSRQSGGDAYQRLVRHERSLWLTTVAVVAMSAITIAILTAAAAFSGAFRGTSHGFLLAGGSLLLLGGFIAYVAMQRDGLEENRRRILEDIQTKSEDLAEANRALQEAMSAQETFLNCVSHELKTPLTCMIGYADLLATGRLEPSAGVSHAKGILEEGRSLNEIIDRILDITRIQGGALRLDRATHDLQSVVQTAMARVEPESTGSEVQILGEFSNGPFPMPVDRGRIEDGLVGVLHRALQRSVRGAKVFVHIRELGEQWVEVSVEDRGPSMSPEERADMFRPFAEINIAPNGRVGDLGLELPLFRRVANAHGGDVVVQAVGIRGTRFRILLPRETAEQVPMESSGSRIRAQAG